MAILRSRAVESQVHTVANPSVQRAIQEWEVRVAQAREVGRLAGLDEAKARIADAEKRALAAETKAEDRQKARHAELLARLDPLIASLGGAVGRFEPLHKQLVQESEAECVRLALAIAATLLRKTVASDPQWMDQVVKNALQRICDRRQITIRLHAQDAAALNERIRDLSAPVPGIETLEILPDAQVPRGTCVLMSKGTRLDASLSGCWERLAEELLAQAPTNDCTQSTASVPAAPATPASPAAKP